jgi:hypothetical protein
VPNSKPRGLLARGSRQTLGLLRGKGFWRPSWNANALG